MTHRIWVKSERAYVDLDLFPYIRCWKDRIAFYVTLNKDTDTGSVPTLIVDDPDDVRKLGRHLAETRKDGVQGVEPLMKEYKDASRDKPTALRRAEGTPASRRVATGSSQDIGGDAEAYYNK